MIFSSVIFIYYFLPIVLLLFYIVPNKYKNFILFLASLVFYYYSEKKFLILLILSIIVNYSLGRSITKYKDNKKVWLIISLIFNFGLLLYFKYVNFFIDTVNNIFNINIHLMEVVLPLGISFFTFQAFSYVKDIYDGKIDGANNIIDFGMYLSMFPQLIAGPIVRYSELEDNIKRKELSFIKFGNGVERFIIGLSKKVLIANLLGELVLKLNSLVNLSVFGYIVLAVSITLQLYFDFSGYSDMAIGLGKMFGFNFPDNFNYPLIASSITDFWRRWHMTLSRWFRDYVYIPMGGNRVSYSRWILNIMTVWFLTGFWHGASFNFILWGLYYGIILIIEKKFLLKFLEKHKIFSHIYSIILILIGFVLFNSNSVLEFIIFIKNMFGLGGIPFVNQETLFYIKNYLIVIIIAIIFSIPIFKNKMELIYKKNKVLCEVIEIVLIILLLIVNTSYIVNESYNPFLYFRF